MDRVVPHPTYVLTSYSLVPWKVILFGDRAFKEVILYAWCPYKNGRFRDRHRVNAM